MADDAVVIEKAELTLEELEMGKTKSEDIPALNGKAEIPLVFTTLSDDLSDAMRAACGLQAAEVVVNPSGCALPESYCHYAQRIRGLEVRPDDVWVLSFPKSGSHVMQEMVWLMTHNKGCEEVTDIPLHQRFIFLEYVTLQPDGCGLLDTISCVEEMLSPRYIKSHLPMELLPAQLWTKKPKIIYVGRNPKDTAVDYFAHYQMFYKYSGSQDTFFEAFYKDKVVYSPFWEHILAFWEKRKEPNVLITTFDEMSQNLPSIIKRVSSFLEVAGDKESEASFLHHVCHQFALHQPSGDEEGAGSGQKSGRVSKPGLWRSTMTRPFVEKFDRWTKEKLAGTDFSNVFMII